MLNDIINNQFLQNAILTCIISAFVCGIIGVIIVEKKLVMMSGGIAHTAFGGVGLGYLLGFEPIYGAFGFAALSSAGIGYAKKKAGAKTDVVIGLLWSLGMASGILFMGLRKGYAPDISSYLFGSILTVRTMDIILMSALSVIVVIVITIFFPYWKSYLFDEEFAKVSGLKTTLMEYLLLLLISMTVVTLINSVGIILVIALLTAPAATASFFTNRLRNRMILAIILSMLFSLSGLYISYILGIASGAAIVFVSIVAYFAASIIRIGRR